METLDNKVIVGQLIETLQAMLFEETAGTYCTPSAELRDVQFISLEILVWLRKMDSSQSRCPLKLDLSKPFGQKVIAFVGSSTLFSNVILISDAHLQLSDKLLEAEFRELCRLALDVLPSKQPNWR